MTYSLRRATFFIILSLFLISPQVSLASPIAHPTDSSSPGPNVWLAGNLVIAKAVQVAVSTQQAEAEKFVHQVAVNKEAELAQSVQIATSPLPRPLGNDDAFLACTRAHESDTAGGYRAVSPDGTYHGAYQFLQTTWNSTAGTAGRPDLIGIDPASASPSDQDLLAINLYHSRGTQPWGGRC